MKLFCWNVQGLGSPRTFRALRSLLKAKTPDIVFLMETRMVDTQIANLATDVGLPNFIAVSREGLGGGLALLWRSDWSVQLVGSSIGHIDVLVEISSDFYVRFTGFYGHPVVHMRRFSWDLLRRIAATVQGRWVVAGDFNEVLQASEHAGLRDRPFGQMDLFQNALSDCALASIPFSGYPFTWSNRQIDTDFVEARLDRGLANAAMFHSFEYIHCHHIDSIGSDHKPLFFLFLHEPPLNSRKRRRFHFEEFWVSEASCGSVIQNAWSGNLNSGEGIVEGLSSCANALQRWNKNTVGNIFSQIQQTKRDLSEVQRVGPFPAQLPLVRVIESRLDGLLEKAEVLWKQRSRVDWLRLGDRNTRFFHERAKTRTRTNSIVKLMDGQGVWHTDSKIMGGLFCQYFSTLFSSSGGLLMHRILNLVEPRVTERMNERLLLPFT